MVEFLLYLGLFCAVFLASGLLANYWFPPGDDDDFPPDGYYP